MHGRRFRFTSLLILVMFALSLFSAGGVRARPLALQSDDKSKTAVDGNSYTSPTFGYSVAWDSNWTVTNEVDDSDYNQLSLTNDISTVYFEGIVNDSDLKSCIDAMVGVLEGIDGVSNVQPLENDEGPIAGSESDQEWAIFTLSLESDSDTFELAYYIDCRPIVEGESLLVISMETALDDLESQADALDELLAGVAIDGSTGSSGDDGNNVPDDNGSGSDTADFIAISGDDIDAFWQREFPKISGGKAYVAPAEVISFDQTVETDCGTASPMEIGPFYCPPSQKIYYDLEFAAFQLDIYKTQSVIAVTMAHEWGHHIQNLMDWAECNQTPCLNPSEMTSQEFELQADCFAGAWIADAEGRGRLGGTDVETNITQFAQLLGDEGIGNTADPGAHGKGARRVYQMLTGYYEGVTTCLEISAATDPARNGGANANSNSSSNGTAEPTPEVTAEATEEATAEAGNTDLIAIGDEFTIELPNASLAMTVTDVDTAGDLGGGREADGQFVVVYFSLDREAEAAGPFPYDSFILVDNDGNEYDADVRNTDAYLKTSSDFPDGTDQEIESGTTYNLAIVFDVPTDTSGFIFGTADGDFQVDLEI